MKNNRLLFCLIFVIAFAVFNVAVFQLPIDRTEIFWITYGFTCVAFAILFAVWNRCFFLDETPKSRFLGYGITYVATYYFVAQLVLFVIVLGVPDIKKWLVIIANTVLLGIGLIGICSTQIGKNYIGSIDQKVAIKVDFIKNILVDLELIANDLTDTEEKRAMDKLLETVRYSDPMSSDKLAGIEQEIDTKVSELKFAENKLAALNLLEKLFVERNAKCKAYK